MDDNQKANIQQMIDASITKALKFPTKKYGDTPTDDLQLVPKKYVSSVFASVSSMAGVAGGDPTDVQINRGGQLYGDANFTMTGVSSVAGFGWGHGPSSVLSIAETIGSGGAIRLQLIAEPDGAIILAGGASDLDIRTSDKDDNVATIKIVGGTSTNTNGGAGPVYITGGDDGVDGGGAVYINGGQGYYKTSVVGAVRINSASNGSNYGTTFIGGTIGTSATSGFVYIPKCAGTPTSSLASAGAMLFDTTASKLWIFNGVWKSVILT